IPVARAAPSGTLLITSTPPATTTSCCPDITACTAKSSACWLEPQARLTVVPGMDSGHPAARTEYRPMLLDWSPTCDTQPQTTSSTIPGSTPARSTSAVSTSADKSAACISDSPPLRLPTGVRTASTITALRIRRLHSSRAIGRADGPLLAQPHDVVLPESKLCQDSVRVFAQSGNRPHRRIVSADDRRRQQRLDRTLRCIHLTPAVTRGKLRVNDHLAGGVVARVADPGLVGHLLDLGEIMLCTPGSDRLVEDLTVRASAGIGGETRVLGEVGTVDDLPGDPLPLPVVGGAEHHGLPVPGRECPVGRHRW